MRQRDRNRVKQRSTSRLSVEKARLKKPRSSKQRKAKQLKQDTFVIDDQSNTSEAQGDAADSTLFHKTTRYKHHSSGAQRFVYGLAGFLLLVVLFRISQVSSYTINVNGQSLVDEQSIYHFSAKRVADNRFWHGIKYFYPVNNLKNELSTPQITVREVSKGYSFFSTNLELDIIENRPSITYFQTGSQQQYLVDIEGVAYRKVVNPQEVQIAFEDHVERNFAIGDRVLSTNTAQFLSNFNRAVTRELELVPQKYDLQASERYLRLDLKNQGYYLKLSTVRPADSQVRALQDTLNHLSDRQKQSLKYIDLRIDGQVIYQ